MWNFSFYIYFFGNRLAIVEPSNATPVFVPNFAVPNNEDF